MSDLVDMVLTAHLGSAWSALPIAPETTLGEFVGRRAAAGNLQQKVAELGWTGALYDAPEDCRVILGRDLRGLQIMRHSLRMFALLGLPRPRLVIEEESPHVVYPRPNKFRVIWRGRQLLQEQASPGQWLAIGPCEDLEGQDPFWLNGKWIHSNQKRRAIEMGCQVISCADAVSQAVDCHLRPVAWELLTLDEVERRLKRLSDQGLARSFELRQIHQLLIRCVKSGHSIRGLERILQAAVRAGSIRFADVLRAMEMDPLRARMDDDGQVPIWSLPPRLEEALLSSWTESAGSAVYSFVGGRQWILVSCDARLRPRLEMEFPTIGWVVREEILETTPVRWMGPLQ